LDIDVVKRRLTLSPSQKESKEVFNERYKQFRKPMAARDAELDETDEVTD
jgi:hypothetical protein